jgi:hypothetical protein
MKDSLVDGGRRASHERAMDGRKSLGFNASRTTPV